MKHFYIGCRVKVIKTPERAFLFVHFPEYENAEGIVDDPEVLNMANQPRIGVTLDKFPSRNTCFHPDELEIISKPPEPEVTYSEELELVS